MNFILPDFKIISEQDFSDAVSSDSSSGVEILSHGLSGIAIAAEQQQISSSQLPIAARISISDSIESISSDSSIETPRNECQRDNPTPIALDEDVIVILDDDDDQENHEELSEIILPFDFDDDNDDFQLPNIVIDQGDSEEIDEDDDEDDEITAEHIRNFVSNSANRGMIDELESEMRQEENIAGRTSMDLPFLIDEMIDGKRVAFPFDPFGVTFQVAHEYAMIRRGRNEELKRQLELKYVDQCEELLAGMEKKETEESAMVELLKVKLEFYSKLGMLDELKSLISDFEDKLDFFQSDELGFTLVSRLCVHPCDQSHQYCQVIELLITKSREQHNLINQQSTAGLTTALMFCAKLGETCKIKKLLTLGASIDMEDRERRTTLSLAAARGYSDTVSVLLNKGANPSGTTSLDACTALEMAMESGYQPVCLRIREHCANLTRCLRDLAGKFVGDSMTIGGKTTPVYTLNLREHTTFSTEFIAASEAFEGQENSLNVLFVAFLERTPQGHYACQDLAPIKSIRLNGKKQTLIMKNKTYVKLFTMEKLSEHTSNILEMRFRNVKKDCKTIVLAQGFVCNFDKLDSEFNGILDQSPRTSCSSSESIGQSSSAAQDPNPLTMPDDMDQGQVDNEDMDESEYDFIEENQENIHPPLNSDEDEF